jgi:hypothetical protein
MSMPTCAVAVAAEIEDLNPTVIIPKRRADAGSTRSSPSGTNGGGPDVVGGRLMARRGSGPSASDNNVR